MRLTIELDNLSWSYERLGEVGALLRAAMELDLKNKIEKIEEKVRCSCEANDCKPKL